MQVEVGHEGVEAVRRHIEGRGEVAQQDWIAHERVGPRVELPELAVGDAMARGHEEEAPVRRDVEAVGALRFRRHLADRDGEVEGGALGAEPDPVQEIRGLGCHVDVVPLLGGRRGRTHHTDEVCGKGHNAECSGAQSRFHARLPFTRGDWAGPGPP